MRRQGMKVDNKYDEQNRSNTRTLNDLWTTS